ncbi:MAG: phosphotransferase [Candidatus Eisenbacteria bacterium]
MTTPMQRAEETRRGLADLFDKTFGEKALAIEPIRADGSTRLLFRLRGAHRSVVGVGHDRPEENAAFLGFTRAFRIAGFPVPEIEAEDAGRGLYLETDLGDETLFLLVRRAHDERRFPEGVEALYREVVRNLVRFQVEGAEIFDDSLCYQTRVFDGAAMAADLAYFREYFLQALFLCPYDGDALERDFETLRVRASGADASYFLYRDFQSRNVMISGGRPWFIDYQSGRRGALPYDLVSLLYDARAELGEPFRWRLVAAYLDELSKVIPVDRESFLALLPSFALLRILQAMGAYGNLGVRQGKKGFRESVPFALVNLRSLMERHGAFDGLPELAKIVLRMIEEPRSVRGTP